MAKNDMRQELVQTQNHAQLNMQRQLARLLDLAPDQLHQEIADELAENPLLEAEEEEVERHFYPGAQEYSHRDYAEQKLKLFLEQKAAAKSSYQEQIAHQLRELGPLSPNARLLAEQIIGNINPDGYLQRSLEAIVEDIAIEYNVELPLAQAEAVLKQIQSLDPPGLAARSIQESLLLQIKRKEAAPTRTLALALLTSSFPLLVNKKYTQLAEKHEVALAVIKEVVRYIKACAPYPLHRHFVHPTKKIVPDFHVTRRHGELMASLSDNRYPALSINPTYRTYVQEFSKNSEEAQEEERKKWRDYLQRAERLILNIKRREETLLATIRAIVNKQSAFFEQGDLKLIKPMFMQDIADLIHKDLSTVSRVVKGRFVQTDWNIYPLKIFFSEGIRTRNGEEVSSLQIKEVVKEIIAKEDRSHPYSDVELAKMIQEKGYIVARRTLSKYRKQLQIPPAQKRKTKPWV